MSTVPEIDAKVLALENIYKSNFYIIPDFQREYVWEQTEVEQLMKDIYEEFYDSKGNILYDGSEYFIGSIVVYPEGNDKYTYKVIDGQQRLITCYLVLCAIRDCLTKIQNTQVPPVLQEMIISNYFDDKGKTSSRYRLALQYKDNIEILENIANKKLPETKPTDTKKNILKAHQTIVNCLKHYFENNPERINEFLAAFTKRVKLIQIVTPNPSHALKIFETLNHRGIDLNAMDLLKNLLFREANEEEFAQIKEKWKILTNILEDCKEKPLRFLRYYILSHQNLDKVLKEDEVYDWFVENSDDCGIKKNQIEFVDTLIRQGQIYNNFVKCKDVLGIQNQNLKNISHISRAMRQHFILLMAGQRLSPELFNYLCFNIENLLFCSVITHVRANVFESNFSQWARKLRDVKNKNDLDAFLNTYFKEDIKKRDSSFDLAFDELTESSVQKYRLNYIIAKLNQFVDEDCHQKKIGLDEYLKNSHIEYILPETPIPSVKNAFDKGTEYEIYLKKLGNLMLIEKTVNTSASNEAYNTKKQGYRQSSYLLNKSLVEMPTTTNTKLNPVVEKITHAQFDTWDSNAILKRQKLLGQLAREVWFKPILEIKEEHQTPKPKMVCPDHNNKSIGYLFIENSKPILKCECGKRLSLNCDRFVFDTSVLVNRLYSSLSNTDFFENKTIFTPHTVIDEINNWKKREEKKEIYKMSLEETECIRRAKDQGKLRYEAIGKNASHDELIKNGRPDQIIIEDAKKRDAIIITSDKDFITNPDISLIIYRKNSEKQKNNLEIAKKIDFEEADQFNPIASTIEEYRLKRKAKDDLNENDIIDLEIMGQSKGDPVGYCNGYTIFIKNAGIKKKGEMVKVHIYQIIRDRFHAIAKIIS